MHKLTQEQLAFIDRYLENAGIVYFDVRLEMADHVATAIEQKEGDFHIKFKEYMAAHRDELLTSYKEFKKAAVRKTARHFLSGVIKPANLLFLGLLLVAVGVGLKFFGTEVLLTILYYGYAMLGCIMGLHFICAFLFESKRFSGTWNLLSGSYISVVWILWFFDIDEIVQSVSPYAVLFYYIIFTYLFIVFYKVYFSINKKLVERYNTLKLS
ncbi:MAG: hypothetical protein ACO1N9_14340 [Flavobacterium sp.]